MKTRKNKPIEIMFGTGVSSYKTYDGLITVIDAAVKSGICGFDTAPSYHTEEVLGQCLRESIVKYSLAREDLFIQTKIDAWQMMESPEKIQQFVLDIVKKMGVNYLDALLIHWAVPEYFDKTWKCMEKLHDEGITRQIGICNVRMRQLNLYADLKPDLIQIERNPLRTCTREIAFCHEHGIEVQAYGALCKMHEEIRNSEILQQMAKKYNKNVGQIVMRWHLDTGVVPIFSSKKVARIQEYACLSDFSLTVDEIAQINTLNRDYKMYLEACACPGF